MTRLALIGAGALALSCAACAATDPYRRAGMWQPSGATQGNLAAMVADRRDLIAGHGDTAPAPHQASMALERLWADQPKPFIGGSETQANRPGSTPASPASVQGGN